MCYSILLIFVLIIAIFIWRAIPPNWVEEEDGTEDSHRDTFDK